MFHYANKMSKFFSIMQIIFMKNIINRVTRDHHIQITISMNIIASIAYMIVSIASIAHSKYSK